MSDHVAIEIRFKDEARPAIRMHPNQVAPLLSVLMGKPVTVTNLLDGRPVRFPLRDILCISFIKDRPKDLIRCGACGQEFRSVAQWRGHMPGCRVAQMIKRALNLS